AFTASTNVPTIYIQQFWNTLTQEAKSRVYSFQLDEQWFTLNADLLRKALEITLVDPAHPFVSPPTGEHVMDFVNELGYLEEVHFVSKMHVNNLYQPWRAILSLINQFLTRKTSGNNKPRHPVLQMCGQYLDMVAHKPTTKEGGQKKTASEANKPKKPTHVKKPAPGKQTKLVKEKATQPPPTKKIHKGKAPVGGVDIREPTSGVTRSLPVVKGKGKAIATDEHIAQSLLELQQPKGKSTTDQYIFQRRTLVTEEASTRPLAQPEDDTSANIVCDTLSPPGAEQVLKLRYEDQARSNPGPSHVALAGPNPKPMHKDFISMVYPKVYKSLKHTTEEHLFLENQPSSSGTLSSMKNLDDAFTYGDQFLYDKPTEEEPDKANVETEVESMVTIPIHQASPIAPPLFTPVINLTQPKPVSPPNQELIFTVTTTTTTTLPPPPPPQQQSTTNPALAAHVSALEQICSNFEKKNKVQDQTAQALSSRIFTLENHDLYSKIDKYINENVKEAIQDALQALIRESFRELSEFEMKEILHLENREEFMDAMAKSRKRHRDDQDPPPPPKDFDQTWKSSDIREAPSSSSQHKTAPQSEQPVDDIPIPNDVHILDSKDAGTTHLLKIKTRPDWLKPVPYEETPENIEPDWVDCEVESQQSGFGRTSFQDQIDLVNPKGNRVMPDVSKPLPLGGPPGNKERRNALSISKMKVAYYQEFGLEELLPSLWIESERECDISATYEIVLRRADYKEYKIFEADFKNMHLNDFDDLYQLHLQGKLNHLYRSDKVHLFNTVNLWIRNIVIRKCVEDLQLSIESYQTKLNLTETSWDTTDFLFKEDYSIVSKSRAFNHGMEHRIWSVDDKRRSKEFIEVIERRLKIRRIFRSLESFVSERETNIILQDLPTEVYALVRPSSEQSSDVNHSETEITSDSNIIPYSHVNDTLTAELERYKEQVKVLKEGQNVDLKKKESLMQTVTLLKNDFKKEESRSIDREIALEKKIKQLNNIKAQQLEPKLYDGNVINNTCAIVIPNSEETLMLAEESHSKMLLKQQDPMVLEKKVNTTPVDYNSMNSSDPSPSCRPTKVEVPKELPKVSMVNTSLKKLKHHLAGFDVVVKERTTATTITEGSWGFEHTKACFRDEIIPFVKALKDIFNTFDQYLIDELTEVQNVFHQMEQAVEQHRLESKTFEVKMNQVLNENERLLEQVINKDIVNIIMNSSVDNAYVNVHECEKCLKLETELLNKKDFIEKETYDKLFRSYTTLEKHCISLEVDTQLNQEIFQRDNSVSNQSAPSFYQYFELNELKAQSQEKDTVIKKLKERIKSLSENMNEDKVKKDIEEIETLNIELDHRKQGLTVTALKDELRKLKGKGLADNVFSKHTIDPEMLKIDVEYLNPRLLNNRSAHSNYLKHTQEEAAILREIVEQGKSQNPLHESLDSALKPSTSASGSQPSGNLKKDKIQRTPSRTQKNKVEAHPRTVKSSLKNKNSVVEPKGTANVQHSKLNANSELLCVKYNGYMLSDNHYLYTWRPTGPTFTIVGNACPLTRITTTAKVPLRKLTTLESDTPKPVVTLVYSKKPKISKTNVPVSKPKNIKSLSAKKKEPGKSWGFIVSDVPSFSLDECRSSKLFSGI
ncbi:hypothetical protein Tco_0333414, partial [Tanacetum coccineum]